MNQTHHCRVWVSCIRQLPVIHIQWIWELGTSHTVSIWVHIVQETVIVHHLGELYCIAWRMHSAGGISLPWQQAGQRGSIFALYA